MCLCVIIAFFWSKQISFIIFFLQFKQDVELLAYCMDWIVKTLSSELANKTIAINPTVYIQYFVYYDVIMTNDVCVWKANKRSIYLSIYLFMYVWYLYSHAVMNFCRQFTSLSVVKIFLTYFSTQSNFQDIFNVFKCRKCQDIHCVLIKVVKIVEKTWGKLNC